MFQLRTIASFEICTKYIIKQNRYYLELEFGILEVFFYISVCYVVFGIFNVRRCTVYFPSTYMTNTVLSLTNTPVPLWPHILPVKHTPTHSTHPHPIPHTHKHPHTNTHPHSLPIIKTQIKAFVYVNMAKIIRRWQTFENFCKLCCIKN